MGKNRWQDVGHSVSRTMRAGLRALPAPRRRVMMGLLLWILIMAVLSGSTLAVLTRPGRGVASSLLHIHFTPTAQPVLTAPAAAHAAFGAQNVAVAPIFQPYYTAHAGAVLLGTGVTAALPMPGGWLQFFQDGALFLPGTTPTLNPNAPAPSHTATLDPARLTALLQSGQRDAASGVTTLPVLSALLIAGSQLGISSPAGPATLTYAALRQAMNVNTLVPAPAWYVPNHPEGATDAFVPVARNSAGVEVGRLVPLPIWQALIQDSTAPDGWLADYGKPLTEALAATAVEKGVTHHLLIQAFAHTVLVMDATPGVAPAAQIVPAGADYLKTFGPPRVALATSTHAWVTGDTIARKQPNETSAAQAHVGLRFPLTLTGQTLWTDGALWYQASWHAPHATSTGWIAATALGFVAPAGGPAEAGFDVLDPALAAYLAGYGNEVGVVAYDVTRGVSYSYNANGAFITASSIKVPIMLALLTQVEAQGRGPNSNELYWLNLMIEHSDNEAAQILYEEIGDAPGMLSFAIKMGVSGIEPTSGIWGWSYISPQAMVQLLTMLQTGQILNASDRNLALTLMQNIESDQQFGVGDTAPSGAVVAMKDGWVPGPDGLWDVNTSGIVTIGSETYIISVYTEDDEDGYDEGVGMVEHICSAVAQSLT